MSNITIVYEEGSGTIRQMPENYMLAHNHKGHWIVDPDSAADWKVIKKLFRVIFFSNELRWTVNGGGIVERFKHV